MGFSGHTGTNEFTWASGTMIGDKRLQIFSHVVDSVININNSVRLDVANAGTWSEVFYQEYTTSNSPNTKKILRLDSDLKFDMMSSQPAWISPVSNSTLRRPFSVIGGPGALKGGRFMALTFQGMHNSNTPFGQSGYATYSTPIIELASGMTHSFSDLHIFGYEGPLQLRNSNLQAAGLAWIKSFTNSVPATINYTGTQGQVAFYTYFQDINASSANTIYVYSGGQSGSTNISAIDFGGGATTSGGTKAFTYIN